MSKTEQGDGDESGRPTRFRGPVSSGAGVSRTEALSRLRAYVYVYIDPRDGQSFYVGKGQGDRLFAHLTDRADTAKTRRIEELRDLGLTPRIDVLRHGLTEAEATLVEAAAIDLVGRPSLTNLVAGHHSRTFGRITAEDALAALTATVVKVREPALLITVNHRFRSDMTPTELLEATRGIWVIGPRRRHVAFLAAGVADALVYRVLGDRSRRVRVSGSNAISAAVDSLVFPTIAFGAFMPAIVLGQRLAKVVGGAIWLEVLSALSLWRGAPRTASHADA